MGTDITMRIVDKNGSLLSDKDIFKGRNYEWFDNLAGRWCSNVAYTYLPKENGDEIRRMLENNFPTDVYYGHACISVGEYKKWFETYKPHLNAGWVHKKDVFNYRVRNIDINTESVYDYLPEDENALNYEWFEFEDKNECGKWLYDFISSNEYFIFDYIIWAFDC